MGIHLFILFRGPTSIDGPMPQVQNECMWGLDFACTRIICLRQLILHTCCIHVRLADGRETIILHYNAPAAAAIGRVRARRDQARGDVRNVREGALA
jgi:hypothetical protein